MNPATLSGNSDEREFVEIAYDESNNAGVSLDNQIAIYPLFSADGEAAPGGTAGRIEIRSPGVATSTTSTVTQFNSAAPGRRVVFTPVGSSPIGITVRGRYYTRFEYLNNALSLSSVRLSGRRKLEYVVVSNQHKLKSLDFTNSPSLFYCSLYSMNGIERLSFSGCPRTTTVVLSTMQRIKGIAFPEDSRLISTIALTSLPSFEQEIDFRRFPNLAYLTLSDAFVGNAIDLRNSVVGYFDLSSNQKADSVHLSPSAFSINAYNNSHIKLIDASSCDPDVLSNIYAEGCSNLSSITVPQGWNGSGGKAALWASNCNLNEAAIIDILSRLGTFQGYTSFLDFNGNPGAASPSAALLSAVATAENNGWFIAGIVPPV